MNRNQRRSRIGFILLGSCLVATIAVAPASAALSSGYFFVHAQNTQDPSIQALAGVKGLSDDAGGSDGGSDPDGGENSAAVTFKAGPLSTSITEAMLAFSEANRKAQEEGRTGDIRTDPDGWQTIWSYDAASNRMVPGIVGAEDDLSLVVFSKGSVAPSVNDAAGSESEDIIYQFFRQGRQSDYSITDYRVKPKDGAVFSYRATGAYGDDSSRNYYAETRYVSEDGGIVAVTVSKQADGRFTIQRSTNIRSYPNYSKSPSKPYFLAFKDGQPDDMSILLPDASAGYNQIQVQRIESGGFEVFYRTYLGEKNGQNNFEYKRTDGPMGVRVDESGKFINLQYIDRNGDVQSVGENPTVADYNRVTGQNWDGKYNKFSDFDLSFPFQATNP